MQTDRKKIQGRDENKKIAPNSGEQTKRLEMPLNAWRPKVGEKAKQYYMKCPELGVHEWELTTGPDNLYAAIKMKLARIDEDEAFPVSVGKKDVEMLVRFANSNHVMRFNCTGMFHPKYAIERKN